MGDGGGAESVVRSPELGAGGLGGDWGTGGVVAVVRLCG